MKFSNEDLEFLIGAVDGVRSNSTKSAITKGRLLEKLAIEIEMRAVEVPTQDVDVNEVSDE